MIKKTVYLKTLRRLTSQVYTSVVINKCQLNITLAIHVERMRLKCNFIRGAD